MFDDKQLRVAYKAGRCTLKCMFCGDQSHGPDEWRAKHDKCPVCEHADVRLICRLCNSGFENPEAYFDFKHGCRKPIRSKRRRPEISHYGTRHVPKKPQSVSRRGTHDTRLPLKWRKLLAHKIFPITLALGVISLFLLYLADQGRNSRAIRSAPDILNDYGCNDCHDRMVSGYGPSWSEVANRYGKNGAAISMIIASIVNGSEGKWSSRISGRTMPPFYSEFTYDELNRIAKYILSSEGSHAPATKGKRSLRTIARDSTAENGREVSVNSFQNESIGTGGNTGGVTTKIARSEQPDADREDVAIGRPSTKTVSPSKKELNKHEHTINRRIEDHATRTPSGGQTRQRLSALNQRDVFRSPLDRQRLQKHFLTLQRRIRPPFAVDPGTSVSLEIFVEKGGVIQKVLIKETSGHASFDQYVVDMIKRSSPIVVFADRIGPDAYYRFTITLSR